MFNQSRLFFSMKSITVLSLIAFFLVLMNVLFINMTVQMDEVIVNIRDAEFGASGDGITDDTIAIQKALDLNKFEEKKLVVQIPEGTYLISGTLKINSNTSIVGSLPTRPRILKTGLPFNMFEIDTVTNVQMLNLVVDGGVTKELFEEQWKLYNEKLKPGVQVVNCGATEKPLLNCLDARNRFSGIRIFQEKLVVTNPLNADLPGLDILKRLENIILDNVDCRGSISSENQPDGTIQACIVVEHAFNVKLNNLTVFENIGSGLLIWNGQNISVTGGRFHHNLKGSGITGGGYSNVSIKNNLTYDNSYTNISMNGVNTIVEGNISYGSKIHGITIGHGHAHSKADNARVVNNKSYNNRFAGICLTNADRAEVTGNQIYGNSAEGVLFHWAPTVSNINAGEVVIKNNRITFNKQYGMRLGWGRNNNISNNYFQDNQFHDVFIDGGLIDENSRKPIADTKLIYNVFLNQSRNGEDVKVVLSPGTFVLNNRMKDNFLNRDIVAVTAEATTVSVGNNSFEGYSEQSKYKIENQGSFEFVDGY